jgi:hypothetical protein
MSEEQTVADIAALMASKNKDIACQMLGCHTLKEVFDRISRMARDSHNMEFSGFSHRASEGTDFHPKKFEFIEKAPNLSNYRNVFGDKP